jgi:hypothetical protein
MNGPKILDKFVGAAEKNLRLKISSGIQAGSALDYFGQDGCHCTKTGSVAGDTTGGRDSIVNQLLAKRQVPRKPTMYWFWN